MSPRVCSLWLFLMPMFASVMVLNCKQRKPVLVGLTENDLSKGNWIGHKIHQIWESERTRTDVYKARNTTLSHSQSPPQWPLGTTEIGHKSRTPLSPWDTDTSAAAPATAHSPPKTGSSQFFFFLCSQFIGSMCVWPIKLGHVFLLNLKDSRLLII